ncbi:phosphoadenosine phosphosulfate reductase [Planifilum fulgidum]|jgi:phosphoadenosine phosphosulfate reductase|uniref:Adenosine 5'-phosphosulfate reductase n=1 Tax=Planifilum fulgidum TaxID=201973 RepID=A0A1I2LYT6_9BACL|nr:phosphoadenosine phosphosulfate reductase [Planifilum fulgidum]
MNESSEKIQVERKEIQRAAKDLRDAHPSEILAWGVKKFGSRKITLACSFGAEDVALVDMLQRIDPEVDIFYLDTDLHFPETYQTRDRLTRRYGKKFIRVTPDLTLEQQAEKWGDRLWERDPNLCCRLRKVEPLKKMLVGYQAWITGIRREQSPTRAHAEVVEWDEAFGLVKLNPLAYWTHEQVWSYIRERNVPYNPLHDRQYPSIGCQPCTIPVKPGQDFRAGRWAGFDKTECGLHPNRKGESQ